MKSKKRKSNVAIHKRRKKISGATIRGATIFLILSVVAGLFLRKYLLELPSLESANEYTAILKRSAVASETLTGLHQEKKEIDFSELDKLEQITAIEINTQDQTNSGQRSNAPGISKTPMLEGIFFGANSTPLAMLNGTLIHKGGKIEDWELIEITKTNVRIKHIDTGDEQEVMMYKGTINDDEE